MKKYCPKCERVKDGKKFRPAKSRYDGLTSYCRVCAVKANKEWSKQNPDKIKKYSKDFYLKNVDDNRRKAREYSRKRRKIPGLKAKEVLLWQKKYPEKFRAHWTLRTAIRRGKLKRLPCEVCGKEPSHAHHDDYSKPLQVRFLCPVHHKEIHK